MSYEFRHWLEEWMEEQDINVVGLAKRLHVSHAAVSDWLRGKTRPREKNIQALSCLTGTPREDIYRLLGCIEPLEAENPEQAEWERRLISLFRRLTPEGRETLLIVAEGMIHQHERREKKQA